TVRVGYSCANAAAESAIAASASASFFNMFVLLGERGSPCDYNCSGPRLLTCTRSRNSIVSLLALLAALAAQYAFPPPDRSRLTAFYGRLALSVAKRLNMGDRNSGILAWAVLVAIVIVPVGIVTWVAASVHPVGTWLLDATVMYFPVRFLSTSAQVTAIEAQLRANDVAGAANRL